MRNTIKEIDRICKQINSTHDPYEKERLRYQLLNYLNHFEDILHDALTKTTKSPSELIDLIIWELEQIDPDKTTVEEIYKVVVRVFSFYNAVVIRSKFLQLLEQGSCKTQE